MTLNDLIDELNAVKNINNAGDLPVVIQVRNSGLGDFDAVADSVSVEEINGALSVCVF